MSATEMRARDEGATDDDDTANEVVPVVDASALSSVLDEYDAQTSQIPLGHENVSMGRSTYNWRRTVVQEIRAMLALRQSRDAVDRSR